MGEQTGFKAFHPSFRKLIGERAEIRLLEEENWAFAHEAGAYLKDSGHVYFTSNRIAQPDGSQKIVISKINLDASPIKSEIVNTNILMGNGGIKYKNGVLFCEQGTMERPGAINWMEDRPPYKVTTIIDSFQGRPFNSPNDVVVHSDGSIWFTDPIYGYMQGFKPKPSLPSQVYRYDPATKAIRAVADGFKRPNGICFSPDQTVVYVSDTEQANGDGVFDQGKLASMWVSQTQCTLVPEVKLTWRANSYAFDIVTRHGEHFLTNRRLFAFTDNGIPDGIKVDTDGNVYSGCGDGIHVWSPGGVFLGKIVLPGGVANFVFCNAGEIIALNENRLYHIRISPTRVGVLVEI